MSERVVRFYTLYFSKFFNTDLHLFEASVWLLSFGQALLSVFIPIILYEMGLSIHQIVIFYLIFNAVDVPLNLIAQNFIQRHGARNAVIVSVFAKIGALIVLFNMQAHWADIIALAVLLAVFDAFYWVGHLYIFARASHKGSVLSSEVSSLQAARTLGIMAAPLIGAYVLVGFDEKTLVFFSAIVMCLSLVPLFMMRHLKFIPELPAMDVRRFFSVPAEKVNYFFNMLIAIRDETEAVIWPFFIYFVYKSVETVAFIPTLISVASLFLIYFAGKFGRTKRVYKFIAFSSLCIALIWGFREVLFVNQNFVMISVFAVSLLSIFMDIPLEVAIFNRSQQTDPLTAVTYLNLVRMLARAIFYAGLLFVTNFFGVSFAAVTACMFALFFASLLVPKNLLKSKG